MNRLPGLGTGITLCICLVLASLFSENFTAACADHDCRGGECPVCLLIQEVRLLVRQFRYTASRSGFFPGAAPLVVLVSGFAVLCPASASSVKLKVKMNE